MRDDVVPDLQVPRLSFISVSSLLCNQNTVTGDLTLPDLF